jgi:hypothetical protein
LFFGVCFSEFFGVCFPEFFRANRTRQFVQITSLAVRINQGTGHSEGCCARGRATRRGRGASGALHAMTGCLGSAAVVPRLRFAVSESQPLARKATLQRRRVFDFRTLACASGAARKQHFPKRWTQSHPHMGFDFRRCQGRRPGQPAEQAASAPVPRHRPEESRTAGAPRHFESQGRTQGSGAEGPPSPARVEKAAQTER